MTLYLLYRSMEGINNYDRSGGSVSISGDVNKDGLDDIMTGAIEPGGYTGESYIVYGSTSLPERCNP